MNTVTYKNFLVEARKQALPSSPVLRHWLQAPGSLTARLRRHGVLEVRVQQQGKSLLWPPEQGDLQQASAYVREVVLLLDGRPVVWARSATSQQAVQGPWRALQGLGTRPLAELLFGTLQVARSPLRAQRIAPASPLHNHMRRQWMALDALTAEAGVPLWARSSVFWRKGHALRVMEAFSPWVATLQ